MESIIGCEGSWPGLAVGQKKSSAEVVSITLEEFVDCLLAATAEDVNPKVSTPASDWPAN